MSDSTVLCEVDGITASHVDNTWLWLNVPASTVVEGVPTLHLPGGSSLAFEVLEDDPGSYRITLTEDATGNGSMATTESDPPQLVEVADTDTPQTIEVRLDEAEARRLFADD